MALGIFNEGSILANVDGIKVESSVATAFSFPTDPNPQDIPVGSVPIVIQMAFRPTAEKLYQESLRLQTHDPAVGPTGDIHIALSG
jgi:hypothetical protein